MINPQTINTQCIMQLPKNKRKFEKALVESINETFASFGPNCAEALYYHLEETFRIKKQDIPNKIEEFADAIEQMFGVSARLIEIK